MEDTIHPLILNVTSLSDAIEAPVSVLQPEVTSTGEPAAPVDQVASIGEPAAPVDQVASTGEPAAQVDQVASTGEPAAQVDQVASTGEPAAPVDYAALSDDVTANPLQLSGPMQAFDHQALHDLEAACRMARRSASSELMCTTLQLPWLEIDQAYQPLLRLA